MEYRKLIKFGKSSYVVSLPKGWLESNNIAKGDTVLIDERDNEVVISSSPNVEDNHEKEITIDVSAKDEHDIRRAIVSAYIEDNHTIIIKGSNISSKSKIIRDITHNLVALEILEQTSDKIIAKDFLDMKDTSINNLIRKMDIITRSMIMDSCTNVGQELNQNLDDRDADVNRLSYLLFRAIKAALSTPSLAKHMKMSSIDLLNAWQITAFLEKIADEAKRVFPYLNEIAGNKKLSGQVFSLFKKIDNFYIDMMKTLYSRDKDGAFNVAKSKKPLLDASDELLDKHYGAKNIAQIISKFRLMVENIHNIGRIVYG